MLHSVEFILVCSKSVFRIPELSSWKRFCAFRRTHTTETEMHLEEMCRATETAAQCDSDRMKHMLPNQVFKQASPLILITNTCVRAT